METAVLPPTGKPFFDAMRLLEYRLTSRTYSEDERRLAAQRVKLVHGIGHTADGTAYGHAWLEEQRVCWDSGIVKGVQVSYGGVSRARFDRARRIERATVTRYSSKHARVFRRLTGTDGPWEGEYLALMAPEHLLSTVIVSSFGLFNTE